MRNPDSIKYFEKKIAKNLEKIKNGCNFALALRNELSR